MLGPVRRVTGSARVSFPERTITSQPKAGQTIKVNTPTHIAAVLDFAAGPVGTLTTSFDTHATKATSFLEIYGSEGTLLVRDPNQFGDRVFLRLRGEKEWRGVPLAFPYAENSRGLGFADLATAIERGRPQHQANGEMALHVLDIMHAVHDASREGRHVELQTAMQRPAAFPAGLVEGQVD